MESSLHCRSRGWKIANLEGGGGGQLPKGCSLWYSLTKKVVFLTVAGFGIFGPHKILGVGQPYLWTMLCFLSCLCNISAMAVTFYLVCQLDGWTSSSACIYLGTGW